MNYNDIFVNRIGKTLESFMRTKKLVQVFEPDSLIKFDGSKLITYKPDDLAKSNFTLDNFVPTYLSDTISYVKIKGKFVKSFLAEKTENNILGKNDWFITQTKFITIPETVVTEETLEIFGCKLIKPGDIFSLKSTKELPLFEVSVGKEYVKEYLLKENFGNGFYIETHDTPHYHQPLDLNAGGFLILGLKEDAGLILTKFKIPFGYGVYMKPETLHSDAFLVGNYNVVYTKTSNYSTYLFTNSVNQINSIVQVQ